MAEEKEKSAKALKVKKKKWVSILASKSFNSEFLGEIPTFEPQSLVGRAITVNLMSLTRDIKKQNTDIKFFIADVQGDKAVAEISGYYIHPSSLRRLVRREKERIDMSFTCKSSDGKNIRMKVVVVPELKIKGSVSVALKKTIINYACSYVAKTPFENIIRDLISNKLQKSLKDEIRKVYPRNILEVSALYIEKEKETSEKKEEAEANIEPLKEAANEVAEEAPAEPAEAKE